MIVLLIIYLAFISLGLPDSLLGSAWPLMHLSFDVDISVAGLVSMIIAGGTIISSFYSDKIINRFGTINVTIVSVLMTAIALFGISFGHSFILLCILAIPLGLGAGAIDSALNNFVALHYKAKHMNWLHAFWGVGATVGPIIISMLIIQTHTWKTGYFVISMIQFTLVFILLVSIPLWRKIGNNHDDKDNINNNISFKEIFKLPRVKVTLLAFVCYCAIEATVNLWGSSYLVIVKNISEETSALWISFFFVGITIGRTLSGLLSIKLQQKKLIIIGLGLITLGIITLLIPIPKDYLLLGLLLIGLGCAPIFPALIHDTPNNFGKKYSQKMMGMQMTFAYIGTTFMPPIFGIIGKKISYQLFPYFLGINLIIMIIMVILIYNKKMARRINV